MLLFKMYRNVMKMYGKIYSIEFFKMMLQSNVH